MVPRRRGPDSVTVGHFVLEPRVQPSRSRSAPPASEACRRGRTSTAWRYPPGRATTPGRSTPPPATWARQHRAAARWRSWRCRSTRTGSLRRSTSPGLRPRCEIHGDRGLRRPMEPARHRGVRRSTAWANRSPWTPPPPTGTSPGAGARRRPGLPRPRKRRCTGVRILRPVAAFVDECSLHVKAGDGGAGCGVVPAGGPRAPRAGPTAATAARAATSGWWPTTTSPRCSPSGTTRTAGPATAPTASARGATGSRRRPPRPGARGHGGPRPGRQVLADLVQAGDR